MSRTPIALFILVGLAGCTVGPDYAGPVTAVSERWIEPATAGAVETAWWGRFNDPLLTGLIDQAVASGPDVREARARIAEARANREAVAGGRGPQVTAKGSATENVLSENGQLPIASIPGFVRDYSLFDIGFDASWELDFFGRKTREIEAARAREGAADESARDVMMTLAGDIVRSYFELRAAQADIRNAQALTASNDEVLSLSELRYRGGEETRIEVDRAQSAARQSAIQVTEASTRAAAAAYRIATLMGVAPETVVPHLKAPGPIPSSPEAIATGVRSDLLRRRPDVRRAERELAAATADVGVATANLFPRFSLLGGIGQQARKVGDLFSPGSTRLQIGPSFSWPVFSFGAIRAEIRAAGARADAAGARYEKAVAAALSDSEAAINRWSAAKKNVEDARTSQQADQHTLDLARLRFQRGEDNRLDLERARASALASQKRLSEALGSEGVAAVALFKALGGGWEESES